jgi:hypothetical protein
MDHLLSTENGEKSAGPSALRRPGSARAAGLPGLLRDFVGHPVRF